MISLIIKYWKLILDALLLVGVIVLIFLWNPFNLFGGGLKLQDTANMVSEVREIGQLVTAEYYGEVLASLDEARLNLLEEDTLNDRAEILYKELKDSLYSHYINSGKRRDSGKRKEAVGKTENELFKEGVEKDTLDVILTFAVKNDVGRNIKANELIDKQKGKSNLRKDYLHYLLQYITIREDELAEEEFDDFLTSGFESPGFSELYYKLKGEESKNKDKLVMIGRGSVKAGFDFGTLDSDRFHYDKENKALHLFGLKPQILNYDINPWFIPERAVPGFDIIQAGRNVDFRHAVKVKEYCRQKLKTNALKAGILDQAQTYGSEVLKSFFSLMLDEEITHVFFHSDAERVYFNQIAKDSVIHWNELPLIASTENTFLGKIESTDSPALKNGYRHQLKWFINELTDSENLDLLLPDSSTVAFNYFTQFLPEMLADTLIDSTEFETLTTTLRAKIDTLQFYPPEFENKSYWFSDSDDNFKFDPFLFPASYNVLVDFLAKKPDYFEDPITPDSLLQYKYRIRVSTGIVDSLTKLDTHEFDHITLDDKLTIGDDCLSSVQKNDLLSFKTYLGKKNREYNNKTWIFKLHDDITESDIISDVSQDLRNLLGNK